MKYLTKLSLSIIAVLLSIYFIAPFMIMYWHNMAHTIAMHDLSDKLSEQKMEGKVAKNKREQMRATTEVYRVQLKILKKNLVEPENIIYFLKNSYGE